jgi:hypothetical protein
MTTKHTRGNAAWWLIGIIALGVIAYFVFRGPRVTVNPTGEVNGVSQEQIIVEGEVTCLPHRDTTGPTTMECAYGLKTDNDAYYGLDSSKLPTTTPPEYEVGDRISVQGTLVPQAEIPSNFWNTYNVIGMIQMDAFWKFTEK